MLIKTADICIGDVINVYKDGVAGNKIVDDSLSDILSLPNKEASISPIVGVDATLVHF